MKILVVFGTRPEAIKMCPLVLEIKKNESMECVVCITGQHKELLEQSMRVFGLKADYDLNVMKRQQSLFSITTDVLNGMEKILDNEKPDIVLVHGDTTTAMATAMAAFYKKIPIGHVEAGLRTGNIYSPYPEEANRLIIDRLSSMLFAPTENNRRMLEKEGIVKNIFVTGNTVIDSFAYTVKENYVFENDELKRIDFTKRVVVITAHRRENWGNALINICKAVQYLANTNSDITFIYSVHPNPVVSETVYTLLKEIDNVVLVKPISVEDMHNLQSKCFLVMTDSGGLQEEAPYFGKPVLVLRDVTERQEAVRAGTVRVIGTEKDRIIAETERLINDEEAYKIMSNAISPYGDGKASMKIVSLIYENTNRLMKEE